MIDMTTISVRLSDKEEKLFTEYAKRHDLPLSTLLKKALKNQIEEEIDLELIRKCEEEEKYQSDDFIDHIYLSKYRRAIIIKYIYKAVLTIQIYMNE